MDVNECIEKGLLKQIEKDRKKAFRSIEIARIKLKKSQMLFNAGFYEDCLINCYSTMFHSARSILFKDGFKERSHYAIYVYLKEKYFDRLEPRFLNELDIIREERHQIQYSLKPANIKKEQASEGLCVAEEFVAVIKKIVS